MSTAEYQRKYYHRKKEMGECARCKNKAVKGLTLCKDHRGERADHRQLAKAKYDRIMARINAD